MQNHGKNRVIIHGDEWDSNHIMEGVECCRGRHWERALWRRRPALIHKSGGTVSLYIGQKYDPEKIDLVEDGWDHDHCEICYWTLSESNEPEHSTGYTDGHDWICTECYEKFLIK